MDRLTRNTTEAFGTEVITEVVTEILTNVTVLSSVNVSSFVSESEYYTYNATMRTDYAGLSTTDAFQRWSSESTSVVHSMGRTSPSTIMTTTTAQYDSSSCYSGTPAERQVCRDPLFTPNVKTVYMVIFGFLIIAAVVMNSLVLFIMARSHRRKKSSHNVYAASLAFSDLMLVLVECPPIYAQFLFPGSTSEKIFNPSNEWLCIVTFFFNCFFGTASIMTQLALNVDRYCIIIHPLTTRALAEPTKTRAGFILVLVWSVATIPHFGNIFLFSEVRSESYIMRGEDIIETYDVHFCLSRNPSDNPSTPHIYTATVFCIFYLSTIIATLGLYVKIVMSLGETKSRTSVDREDRIYAIYKKPDPVRVHRQKYHRAASRNILRIMGCSIISYSCCYSIYFYVNLYFIYFGLLTNSGFSLIVIANIMGALNALVNPTLFACFSDEFKALLCARTASRRAAGQRVRTVVARSRSYSNGTSNESDSRSNPHQPYQFTSDLEHVSLYQVPSSSSEVTIATINDNGDGSVKVDRPTRTQSESSSGTSLTEVEAEA